MAIISTQSTVIIPHFKKNGENDLNIKMNSIKPRINILLLCVLPIFPFGLAAATSENSMTTPGDEDIYLEELPVIISATRLAQPLNETPVATTTIDRQMIDASGAQTIADLLRLVPGFTVGSLNGNLQVATYHGQSDRFSKRVQLLIDGRSIYLPTISGVSWSDLVITLDDIERIEVIRGPNASTYGNNAFQAVISIITKHASEDQGSFAKVTAGSHNTLDAIYRFGGSSENLDYRVSVNTKNNTGTDLLDDDTATNAFSYRLDFQLNDSTTLFYQGGVQDSVYGDVLDTVNDTPNDVDITTAFQHLKLEHSFESGNSLSVQYFYNFTKSFRSEFLGNVLLSDFTTSPIFDNIDSFDVIETLDLKSERHDLEVSYYYNPLDSLRLVSGGSIRTDIVEADLVFEPGTPGTLNLYRFFTHGEYSINTDWLINAGFMIENNDISGTDVAPRLAIIHHLNDSHSIRLSASRGTRTPTLFDNSGNAAFRQQLTENGGQPLNNPILEGLLGGDTLVNSIIFTSGNVQSEQITSYELGWIAQLLDKKLVLDTSVFYDKSEKLIADVPFGSPIAEENIGVINPNLVGAIDFANAADTNTYGIEISADYQFADSWRLYGYYAYLEIEATETNANANGDAAARLNESVPTNSFGAMIIKQWGNSLNTSLNLYYVDKLNWIDRTHPRTTAANAFQDRSAEAYSRLDFVLRKSSIIGSGRIDYSLILQNLLGDYYDYTKSNYTDASRQTVLLAGSRQDPRVYFELAFRF
ncbi:MAG TPA: TonB-dependent receptor [Gammaproteobacteria bacterium]|nr:TonB-dependent receptor [Gammaproteobacteria bacterium]